MSWFHFFEFLPWWWWPRTGAGTVPRLSRLTPVAGPDCIRRILPCFWSERRAFGKQECAGSFPASSPFHVEERPLRVSAWTCGRCCSCSSSSACAPGMKVRTVTSPTLSNLLGPDWSNNRTSYLQWLGTTSGPPGAWIRFLKYSWLTFAPVTLFCLHRWSEFRWRGC